MKHLPAYPLVTVDPYISIWSMKHKKLYKDNTRMWAGYQKCLHGLMMIDDKPYRFMGENGVHHMHQKVLKVTPLCTTYVFEKHDVRLKVDFWTPAFPDDLLLLSLPCAFIDYEVTILDKRPHSVSISLLVDENFCYDSEKGKEIIGDAVKTDSSYYAYMRQNEQNVLEYSGDFNAINWGTVYVTGGFVSFGKPTIKRNKRDGFVNYIHSEHKAYEPVSDKFCAHDTLFFDDGFSIEYMGEKLREYWTEKFPDAVSALKYCDEKHDELRKQVSLRNTRILRDGQRFGDDYCMLLSAAYREVIASHKLVKTDDGKLLYVSKNCTAGGFAAETDVTYASSPLFLLYNPSLVFAELNGICDFARSAAWKFDFAPHDIGTYPIADGQTYGLKADFDGDKAKIYSTSDNIYDEEEQMPVETSGDVLILAYAATVLSGDRSFIAENKDLLLKWGDYLAETGNDIANQKNADDYAKAISGSVNLAVKSCIALRCCGEICKMLDSDGEKYLKAASENAADILKRDEGRECLSFTLLKKESWSLKYNLVWNYIFGFDLFPLKTAKNEIARYIKIKNEYGLPLGPRRDYARTDWTMWACALDDTGFMTQKLSVDIMRMLDHTEDKYPFTDWYDTKSAKSKGRYHRPVQGGLWMPVLAKKWNEILP